MQVSKAYIVAGLRTAGGRRGGRLSGWHPVDMGAAVLDGLLGKVKVDPALIDDVIFGCVGQVTLSLLFFLSFCPFHIWPSPRVTYCCTGRPAIRQRRA